MERGAVLASHGSGGYYKVESKVLQGTTGLRRGVKCWEDAQGAGVSEGRRTAPFSSFFSRMCRCCAAVLVVLVRSWGVRCALGNPEGSQLPWHDPAVAAPAGEALGPGWACRVLGVLL